VFPELRAAVTGAFSLSPLRTSVDVELSVGEEKTTRWAASGPHRK
jgi:hypothetical protein